MRLGRNLLPIVNLSQGFIRLFDRLSSHVTKHKRAGRSKKSSIRNVKTMVAGGVHACLGIEPSMMIAIDSANRQVFWVPMRREVGP